MNRCIHCHKTEFNLNENFEVVCFKCRRLMGVDAAIVFDKTEQFLAELKGTMQ